MKHRRRSLSAMAVALCLMLAACAASGPHALMSGIPAAPSATTIEADPDAARALARSVNDFSWRLFQPLDVIANDSCRGIVLPYTDPRFAFVALLPKEGSTPRQLAADMDMAMLLSLLESRTTTQVELSLPRFESSDEMELSGNLRELGMEDAFDPHAADFSGMSADGNKDLYFSAVRHKTWIRVDEEGTEAAAATSVEMSGTAMSMPGVALRFDRPFLYAVVDVENGVPLFLGVMEKPQ